MSAFFACTHGVRSHRSRPSSAETLPSRRTFVACLRYAGNHFFDGIVHHDGAPYNSRPLAGIAQSVERLIRNRDAAVAAAGVKGLRFMALGPPAAQGRGCADTV